MTKKHTAVILALTLTAAAFAACGEDTASDTSEPVTSTEESADDTKDTRTSSDDEEKEGGIELSRTNAVAAKEKEETVNVKADASGGVKSVSVTSTLKIPDSGDVVLDETSLTDIKNKEGDEEFNLLTGGTLLWENHGEDITYEGTYNGSIPVGVKVSYYLDGAEVSASELAGKSGRVKIRFDYTNNQKSTVTVGEDDDEEEVDTIVPMTAVTAVVLSDDIFSDIEVENGKLMSFGDEQIVIGYAFPGLYDALSLSDYEDAADTDIPSYVEITAEAEDFSLDYTATVFSNGLFSDMEDEDFEDMDDLIEGLSDLEDASDKIKSALYKMRDGSTEFQTYLSQYIDGVDSLYYGLSALNEGLAGIDPALMSQAGMIDAETAAALTNLKNSVYMLTEGAATLSLSGEELENGYGELAGGLSTLAGSYSKFNTDGIRKLTDKGEDMDDILTKFKALREADIDYAGFSGNATGTADTVRFVIETEEVK